MTQAYIPPYRRALIWVSVADPRPIAAQRRYARRDTLRRTQRQPENTIARTNVVAAMSATPDSVAGNRNARSPCSRLHPPSGRTSICNERARCTKGASRCARPCIRSLVPDRADQVAKTIAYRERLSTDKYEMPDVGGIVGRHRHKLDCVTDYAQRSIPSAGNAGGGAEGRAVSPPCIGDDSGAKLCLFGSLRIDSSAARLSRLARTRTFQGQAPEPRQS